MTGCLVFCTLLTLTHTPPKAIGFSLTTNSSKSFPLFIDAIKPQTIEG